MRRRIDQWAVLAALPFLTQTTLTQAATCAETLPIVQDLYNKTVDECPGADGQALPASHCSGLIVRGTQRPERKGGQVGDRVWIPSASNQALQTVAASYLRKDIVYQGVKVFKDGAGWQSYDSGFIVMPPELVTDGQPKAYIACAAPVDMWADQRTDQGCGDNKKTPEVEGACQSNDGNAWVTQNFLPHMYNETEKIGGGSCAFDLRTMDASKSTAAFKGFLDARRAMQNVPNQDTAFKSYNEVRYTIPENNSPPLIAFYYSEDGMREDALKNQAEYKQDTGRSIPVIKITYPKDKNDVASFSCDAETEPATEPTPAPEPVPAAEPVPATEPTPAVEPTPAPATDTGTDQAAAGGWGTGADPKQCSRYFDSVTWINRWDEGLQRNIDSVSVIPSACGREIGPDQTDAALAEMQAKAKALPGGVGKWGDRDATLRRQFVCHLTLVDKDANGNSQPMRYKREYNLEPIRKYVSHEQSLADKCNTPLTDDQDPGGWGPNNSAQCTQYVSSVRWVPRKFAEYPNRTIMSLEVIPTDCGRNVGPEQIAKFMAEVKRKALAADPRGAEYWGIKDVSMTRQTTCLMKKYRDKKAWNIESIRSDASQEVVDKADCNHL